MSALGGKRTFHPLPSPDVRRERRATKTARTTGGDPNRDCLSPPGIDTRSGCLRKRQVSASPRKATCCNEYACKGSKRDIQRGSFSPASSRLSSPHTCRETTHSRWPPQRDAEEQKSAARSECGRFHEPYVLPAPRDRRGMPYSFMSLSTAGEFEA